MSYKKVFNLKGVMYIRKKKERVSFLIFFFVLISLALGKDFSIEKKKLLNTARRIGPFYFTPYILLKEIGYDYNIYQLETEKEGDWFADVGVGGRLSFVRSRYFLSTVYTPTYLFYLHHKEESFLNQSFFTEGMLKLGKFHFYLNYLKTRQRIRPTFEFGPRIRLRTEGETFSLELAPKRPLSIEVSGKTIRLGFLDESYLNLYNLGYNLDRRENTINLQIKKKIFTATKLFIGAGYKEVIFFHREVNKDTYHHWLSLGVLFPEIGNITGSFKIGYKGIIPPPMRERVEGIFGNGNLRFMIRRIELRLLYSLDWNYSFWTNYLYRQENYGVRLSFYFTRNIKIGGGYTQGVLDFLESDRIDNFTRQEGYLLFRIFGKAGIGISYNLLRTNSSVSKWNRYTSFIGGTITNAF